jgi:hypothetical protein
MPGSSSKSLVHVGDPVKPADALIKRISDAVGCVFGPPRQLSVSKEQAELAVSDLQRRAVSRQIEEEAKHQANIEGIITRAVPLLASGAQAERIDTDWIAHFFDKARLVADAEMQSLWARVLAGEANAPGAYSKRTVNLLADLGKAEAEAFEKLCRFCAWIKGSPAPLIFKVTDPIYKSAGLHYGLLVELEAIGVIQYNATGYGRDSSKYVRIGYHDEIVELSMPKGDKTNKLPLGTVVFTSLGRQLMPICAAKPAPGFTDYFKDQWKAFAPRRVV